MKRSVDLESGKARLACDVEEKSGRIDSREVEKGCSVVKLEKKSRSAYKTQKGRTIFTS
jgi:hypothetical protein